MTNPTTLPKPKASPQRMGHVIRLKPDALAEYKQMHTQVWPEILTLLSQCNIRNYSIFLKEPENLLFAYYEYYGDDFAADMAKMKQLPRMQEWWKITDAMQIPYDDRRAGDWWAAMEPVFFHP
ncbi:MAG: L-rhamnose mutarotase [Candidatus Symbiobacter sp.]|nr:L-rhamnose mutarotase [Candidatus Symbiobacter sp.]